MALVALLRNRSRSLLTMLGVVIGVAAVIVTVAIGAGARTSVSKDQRAGQQSDHRAARQRHAKRRAHRQRRRIDADAGRRHGDRATCRTSRPFPRRSRCARRSSPAATTGRRPITGVAPTYTYIRSWPLAVGYLLHRKTMSVGSAKVAVLGQTVSAISFLTATNPLGQTVSSRTFRSPSSARSRRKGQSGLGQDQDDTIVIPYTSAMQRLTGTTTLSTLSVSAAIHRTTSTPCKPK